MSQKDRSVVYRFNVAWLTVQLPVSVCERRSVGALPVLIADISHFSWRQQFHSRKRLGWPATRRRWLSPRWSQVVRNLEMPYVTAAASETISVATKRPLCRDKRERVRTRSEWPLDARFSPWLDTFLLRSSKLRDSDEQDLAKAAQVQPATRSSSDECMAWALFAPQLGGETFLQANDFSPFADFEKETNKGRFYVFSCF